jgi:hypothetical protein
MAAFSGSTQRFASSISTRLGPVRITMALRSTASGTVAAATWMAGPELAAGGGALPVTAERLK